MQDFKHIRAWQRAHALAIAIHKQTRHFGRMGYSHLRSQLTRAADLDRLEHRRGLRRRDQQGVRALSRHLDQVRQRARIPSTRISDLDLLALPTWQGFNDETIEIRKM